tara:strand:- start:640 stop:1899 length:1260 start_codon:yes stop_codon:yes gene_type:complete
MLLLVLLHSALCTAPLPPPTHRISIDLNLVCTEGEDPPFAVAADDDVTSAAAAYCSLASKRCRARTAASPETTCDCAAWSCTSDLAIAASTRLEQRGWMVREDVVAAYRRVCAAAARTDAAGLVAFKTFKRDPRYMEILEHVTHAMGQRYLDEVALRAPALLRGALWRSIARSDALGGGVAKTFAPPPRTADGLAVDAHAGATPTTLRYVAVLAQLIARFGTSHHELEGFEICEVGGGYGGMAHVLLAWDAFARAAAPERRPITYRIFDLPEVAALQRRYLSALGWGGIGSSNSSSSLGSAGSVVATTLDAATAHELRRCDLVLSNYALSELDEPTQLRYSAALIETARVGLFAAMNHFDGARRGRAFKARLRGRGWRLVEEMETVRDDDEAPGVPSELVVGYAPESSSAEAATTRREL